MKTRTLNGAWTLEIPGTPFAAVPATVPGSVYHDLLAAERIPDPFYRDNEMEALKLMDNDFVYFRSFQVDDALLAGDKVLLRAEGLDTIAAVHINGQIVGEACNMHRIWEFDVKSVLHPGENTITVSFRSPTKYIKEAYAKSVADGSSDAMVGFPNIRKAASQMGYTPNSAARMLKTSRSYNFGVLFEDQANKGLTHNFFSHILNSFKHRAEELGYDISFISDRMGGQEISYVDHARYRNCDGVVIASVDYTEHAVVDLANSGIPVVTIDCVFENCGSVLSDNVGGMTELVKYAYSMGHRKIAFAYGEDTPVTRRRISGFCRACKELGLSLPDEYLVQSMYLDPESSAAATRKLMELPDPPTCILYPDDIAHLGGRNELEKMGLSVPDDVSIVGYDGIDFSQMLRPKLTTMRQDAEQMGELAAEELARAVEEGRSYIPGRHVVGGTLLPGETVKKLTP